MRIKSNIKKYNVNIENNFKFLVELYNKENSFWVIDKKVYNLYKEELFFNLSEDSFYLLEAKEANKTINEALKICEILTKYASKRNTTLISVGGGIVQDVTGFVSSILYRGINWIFIPTTLLASADSCIGSKTSLNFNQYKNLLGTFFPPDQIYICPTFFRTLSDRDYKSGLGELVKFNFMSKIEGVVDIENDLTNLLNRENKTIIKYLVKSLKYKKTFIEKDEFDRKERILLNFAHTYGHAFENISNFEIPHGTAVAMGMICANNVSYQRGFLEKNNMDRMNQILKKIIDIDISKFEFNIENIIKNFKKDKKQTDDKLKLVLLNKDMQLNVVRDVKISEIDKSIEFMKELLKR